MASPTTLILAQTLKSSTPLLVAGFGELLAQRAGVINVGIEGTMLMGAIAAYSAAVLAGPAMAFPAAMAVGIVMAGIFALATVWFRADQIVAGTALNILAAGASATGFGLLQNTMGARGLQVPALFEPLVPGFLSRVSALEAIFSQYALFWIAIPLGIATWVVMARTRAGLVGRSLGDAPDACEAAGISVRWSRTVILLLAGAASGAAGAYLSTMRNHAFLLNMTSGQGFLVLALVIFGRWSVPGFVLGVLAFGLLDGVQSYLTLTAAGHGVPQEVFEMLPYVATLVAMAMLARGRSGPVYLGRAWPE
jgi:simple sugar transport system permease protein